MIVFANPNAFGGLAFLADFVGLAAFPAFFIAVFVLIYATWRRVKVHRITKMEALWWLSVPYSLVFAFYFRALRLERFTVHLLTPFVGVFLITVAAAVLWSAVAICRALFFGAIDLKHQNDKVGLASLVLLPLVLWYMWLSPGQ
jgi:hypothetical protein